MNDTEAVLSGSEGLGAVQLLENALGAATSMACLVPVPLHVLRLRHLWENDGVG